MEISGAKKARTETASKPSALSRTLSRALNMTVTTVIAGQVEPVRTTVVNNRRTQFLSHQTLDCNFYFSYPYTGGFKEGWGGYCCTKGSLRRRAECAEKEDGGLTFDSRGVSPGAGKGGGKWGETSGRCG